MTNILQFVFNKTRQSRKDYRFMRKWGPFFCILASIFLCMADLTRHLVNDAWGTACTSLPDGSHLGIFGGSGSPEMLDDNYDKYCKSVNVANEYTSTGLGMDLHNILHLEWLCVAFRGHLLGDQPPTQSGCTVESHSPTASTRE
eukprot:symbB.v1.2.034647.t1/scaffold4504.1/size42116/3